MLRKLGQNQNGATLIEFAILLPVILSLIFGYISMVNIVRGQIIMQTAAREGARTYANPDVGENAQEVARQVVTQTLIDNRQRLDNIQINIYSVGRDKHVEVIRTFAFSPIVSWLAGELHSGELQTGAVFVEEY